MQIKMEYKLAVLDRQDRKNIYLLVLFFSIPGIIILLVFMGLAIYLRSSAVFIDSLLLISACILLPHIFSVKYLIALKNNQKYIVKGILTSKFCSRNSTCCYTLNEKDKFTTASIGNIFCDKIYQGNIVELHTLPFMYSKKKVFYVKRMNESYDIVSKVREISINDKHSWTTINFSNLGVYTFPKYFLHYTIKPGDSFLIKVTLESNSGKPTFNYEIIPKRDLESNYRF
ncbi:hypothetical protein DCO46_21160 [Flavobacterium sp. HTF]|nr:hypothetical protein DCO46_21160 [Flavobacterium sp. HTF]